MKSHRKHAALAICGAVIATCFTLPVLAADTAVAARATFDGNIRNNSLALSPDETTAVVSYSERPDVVVYNLKKSNVRGVLHGYITPRNIVFAPDGKTFYVSDSSLGEVVRVDSVTLKPVSRLAAGPGAFGTALNKDGNALYVNSQASSTVTRFDTPSNQARAVITGFAQPRQGVRLSPDGSKLYVTNFLGDKVTIVDTQTDKVEGEITGFNKIRAISVTADGKTMFAANSGTNNIAVVDIAKREILSTVAVGKDPYGAALTPDGQFVYSGNLADNTVSVIEVATLKVVATITGFKQPRQAIVFTRDGTLAYVLNEDLSVSKVDRASQKIVGTLSAPKI
jgi:YVTN family beta-propeller protein